jgi:TPR repeat protein
MRFPAPFLALCAALLLALWHPAFADYREADKAWRERNYQAVLDACKADAAKGEKNCQSYLGSLYRAGRAVNQDYLIAAQWFAKAAVQGQVTAQESLGQLYRAGQGVPQSHTEANRLFKLGADQGHPPSLNALAGSYREGWGVPVDRKEMFRLYQLAAEKGHGFAQANLANAYRLGHGTAPDPERALFWARKSAEQNNSAGRGMLGLMNRDGVGTAQNPLEAIRLLKLATTTEPDPVFWPYTELGLMYYKGMGVTPDPAEARKWFEMGAEKKMTASINFLKEMDRTQAAKSNATTSTANVTSAPASASARKALVIGNDSYRSVTPLANARADARAIADALRSLGYAVNAHFDLNEKEMKKAVRDFIKGVAGGDEVVFFYAGHGVQLANSNYLLPVDINADDAETVKDESIPLQRVLDDLNDAKVRLSIAIIDACRDNPFKAKGRSLTTRGLASTTAANGQMILFSAGSGQQALDKIGPQDKSPNGLFTRTLLKYMRQKDLPIDRVMRQVRAEVVEVAKSVGHDQVPALYDQVVGDFYFKRS